MADFKHYPVPLSGVPLLWNQRVCDLFVLGLHWQGEWLLSGFLELDQLHVQVIAPAADVSVSLNTDSTVYQGTEVILS